MIISLVVGIWATAVILAISDSLHAESLREGIEYKYGHLQIHSKTFKKRQELGNTVPAALQLVEEIQQDEKVQAVTARVRSAGMLASAGYSSNVEISGVMPGLEDKTTLLKTRLTSGEYLDMDTWNPIILGEKLTDKLKVGIDKKVVLTFENPEADLVASTFRIVGTFTATQVRDEETIVFVRMEDFTRIAGIPGEANEIVIKLKDAGQLKRYVKDLKDRYPDPDLVIESWQQAAPDMAMVSDMIYQMDVVVTVIVLIVLSFGIVNTMLMVVLERFKELGILMAVGMNRSKVFLMILLETLFLSLAGGVGGLMAGFITINIMRFTGVNLSLFSEGLAGWGFHEVVYPELEFRVYVFIVLAVIVTALMSSLYPSFRAISLSPSEAIRKDV